MTGTANRAAEREFEHENFEWSAKMRETLFRVFGFRNFRSSQRLNNKSAAPNL